MKTQDIQDLAFIEQNNVSEDPNEPVNGYWMLMNVKTEVKNVSKITNWVSNSENIVANARWIDFLKIEHTVSCSFEWDKPHVKLIPGSENKISSTFKNNEYSTTGKVTAGLRMNFEKIGKITDNTNYETIEVLKLKKDFVNHSNEIKLGFFSVPKYFRGDNTEIEFVVDCYIGNDHYTTTYYYKWTE